MSRLLDQLQEPEVRGCPMDGPARFNAHRSVLARKAMIRDVFREFHALFHELDSRYFQGKGQVIELGAGVYPVRETVPGVLATDVVPAPHLDRTLDAEAMDVPDESVRAFYLQNVFHHFPHPSRFFGQLENKLIPGGGAILVEPADGALASCLYPRLFASEGFDKDAGSWDTATSGPMSGANQALSHVIFDRDRTLFERTHPALEVVHRDVLRNWIRYLASGGLNYRPIVPQFASPALRLLETAVSPLRRVLGLHRVIVLRKRSHPGDGAS